MGDETEERVSYYFHKGQGGDETKEKRILFS